MPNTKNASIRGVSSKRTSQEVVAEDAARLLGDPAFIRAYDVVEEGLFNAVRAHRPNGTQEADDVEREYCRSIRTLHSLKRVLNVTIQGQKLRAADFKPQSNTD